MAIIQPMEKRAPSQGGGFNQAAPAKLMPEGQYIGKIVDIGYSSDKENTRKILYAALARTDTLEVSPRIIRARFDIWNNDLKLTGYAMDSLYYFMQAIYIDGPVDTDDKHFLQILINAGLFKDIYFTVAKLMSQNGFSFNVVKEFKPINASTLSEVIQPEPLNQRSQPNPAAFIPAEKETTTPASGNWVDDDVPF